MQIVYTGTPFNECSNFLVYKNVFSRECLFMNLTMDECECGCGWMK